MGYGHKHDGSKPAVMIHAVSVGEINATPALVEGLAKARPGVRFVVSTTTQTGFERAGQLYGKREDVTLIRYPLDFSSAVRRVLDGVRPSIVVLMELEVWPNFLGECGRRGIPVVLVNGRLSEHSRRRYRLVKPLTAGMFRKLAVVCVQDEEYARQFVELGALSTRVRVTGTMKFDTAQIAERVEGDEKLAGEVGLSPGDEKIWVCGSTGPGEEEQVLGCYRRLRQKFQGLRLVIVPRKPERFDEVAARILALGFVCVRRSKGLNNQDKGAVVLGDTMGELRKFYSLASVVFVGRTLVDLGSKQHGSDMIEPAALGKPVIVGRFTGNFADAMRRFREAEAIIEVSNAKELEAEVEKLLGQPDNAKAMGKRAREAVWAAQGATARHVQVIVEQLEMLERQDRVKADANV